MNEDMHQYSVVEHYKSDSIVYDLQPGMKVKIIDDVNNPHQYVEEENRKWLGKILTVDRVDYEHREIRVREDKDQPEGLRIWVLDEAIEYIVCDAGEELDDGFDEDNFLSMLTMQ